MSTPIAYTKPSITELEQRYAADAVATGWGAQCYDYLNRFEAAFAERLESQHTIATSSCTGAMHMGLAVLGIGSGDEVILADTNWIATVSPIRHLGAVPVFVDIDPVSWCISAEAAQQAITPRTRAIIATHLYGNLCDLDALEKLADDYGLALIEDAAEALGSSWHGRPAGSVGRFSTFSFHGTKTMTTGEGGAFVTSDPDLCERVMTLSNHGRRRGQIKQFWPDEIGFKYKMSNVQAAIGCAQLERLDDLVARKRAILAGYRERLAGLNGLAFNPEPAGCVNGAWMPTVVFDAGLGIDREMLLQAFRAVSIDARVFFYPLSQLDMFESVPDNRVAWDLPERAINLPSYHDMTDADQDRVAGVIQDLMEAR